MPTASRIRLGRYMTAYPGDTTRRPMYIIEDRTGGILGCLQWHSEWRRYVCAFDEDAVFSHDCLDALAAGCRELTIKWR